MLVRQANHRIWLSVFVCILVVVSDAWATQDWFRIKSEHFRLIGNATEEQMTSVATGLEHFLPALPAEVAEIRRRSTESTIIVVFKDDHSYEPFRAPEGAGTDEPGYFIAGRDLNFIAARFAANQTQRILNHELFHALYRSDDAGLPVWANEGLADYFSTFDTGFGSAIPHYIRLLQSSSWIPLADLLTANRQSRYYTQSTLKETFYAESWLLIHYLNFHSAGKITGEIVQKTQGSNVAALEMELRQHLAGFAPNDQHPVFAPALSTGANNTIEASPISDSEAHTWEADLLLHLDQLETAERRLEMAMNSQPRYSGALTTKGALRLRQNRNAEALLWLDQAVQEDRSSPLAHFHYAEALQTAASSDAENQRTQRLERSRTELLQTIELAPWLTDAYEWLGYVVVALQDGYAEAQAALIRGIERYPERNTLRTVLTEVKSAEAAHLEASEPAAIANPVSGWRQRSKLSDCLRHPSLSA